MVGCLDLMNSYCRNTGRAGPERKQRRRILTTTRRELKGQQGRLHIKEKSPAGVFGLFFAVTTNFASNTVPNYSLKIIQQRISLFLHFM